MRADKKTIIVWEIIIKFDKTKTYNRLKNNRINEKNIIYFNFPVIFWM